MHYREITRRTTGAGSIAARSSTPWTYMAPRLIAADIRRRAPRGERSRFAVASRGCYQLQAASAVEEAITGWIATVKARLRSRLHELDRATFESLVSEPLKRAGVDEFEVTRRDRDGGVDVRAILVVGGLSMVTTAVQVMRWRKSVPIEIVRDLRGALSVHEQGLIMITSKFTRDATAEASAAGRAPIGLVNGDELIDLLVEHQLGVIKREVALSDIDEELFSGEVVEDPSALTTERDTTTPPQVGAAQRRFRIYRVPCGARSSAPRVPAAGARRMKVPRPSPTAPGARCDNVWEALFDMFASLAPVPDAAADLSNNVRGVIRVDITEEDGGWQAIRACRPCARSAGRTLRRTRRRP
jgi:hypothetical protein